MGQVPPPRSPSQPKHLPPSPKLLELTVPAGMRVTEFKAMGTTISLFLPQDAGQTHDQAVMDLFATWEATLTRFHAESELSRLNQHAGAFTIVSPLLFAVVSAALAAAHATDGIYDPTLLPQLRQAGYDRSFDQIAHQQPSMNNPTSPGGAWRTMRLDAAAHSIFLPTDAQIDLGGIAKGMAVDAAMGLLQARDVDAALLNAGGDLGAIGLPPTLDHWPVAVPDGSVISLRSGAMATSGKTRRHWWQGDLARHHLIDPRTGTSAQSALQTVTVVADQCMQAEVAAKVAFILGIDAALAFLVEHHLEGVLWLDDLTTVMTDGWPHPIPSK